MFSFVLLLSFQAKSFGEENGWLTVPIAGEVTFAYDDFRGIPEGSWNGNTGALVSANFAFPFFDTIALQAGGSYGVYDWYGRGPVGPGSSGSVQQQGFVTAGLFSESLWECGLRGGLVVDWMFNRNFGVFAQSPSFGQLRLQLGYLLNPCNEFGFWGTVYLHTDHKTAFAIPVSYRAIDQVNLFWRHYFENCAETMLWAGIPYNRGLMFHKKTPGQYIVGGSLRVPLTSCLSVDAHGAYMGPRGNHSSPRFQNYDANICIGLSYAFGVAGGCCEMDPIGPYLPVANNSNFFVDTNLND